MFRKATVKWLSLCLAVIMIVSAVPMNAFAAGSVKTYQEFMSALKVLEGYADSFAKTSGKEANLLMINFIRTGVERYNDGNWKTLAGEEIVEFTEYVQKQDNANGTNAMDLRDIVIDDFRLPNGDLTDFGHMFGTLNISYVGNQASADLAGWAGDLCDLLFYSYYDVTVPAGAVDEMAEHILNNCFGVNADNAFGMDDFYGDMDAYYLHKMVQSGKKLSTVMAAYFTEQLSDADRAAYFLNTRFKGLETKQDVRDAILGAYTANVGLSVLEADRGLNNLTDLRKACCYAFADYLYELAGDRLEGGSDDEEEVENPYYTIFSTSESVLAPGITQSINYATTADNKQIVYYVATVDVTRDDVTIMANYKDNNPGGGWGMQRVEEQANALLNNYKDKYENFNVIVATNADGYNMSTGQPGGLLVMGGVEWHPVDGDGFFAILKDGSAMIGTKADYATYKDQIQEAVGGFGATLIKNGEIAINKNSNYYTSRASRTAVGITAEGKVVMMVLDGRQEPFSAGGSMEEIAQIMLEAGCVEAVNLDGGGSTTYLSKPEGSDKLQLVNRPSDGYARSVATSLVAISTAKSSNEFEYANITADYDYLTIGTSLQMTANGVSNTGNAAPLPEGATWKVSNTKIGTITADGVFTALKNGEVDVQLVDAEGNVVGYKTLRVVVPDALSFTKTNITAIFGVPVELPLVVSCLGNPVAFNEDDVIVALIRSHYKAGSVDFLTFTGKESAGIRNATVEAFLMEDDSVVASITVNMYSADEAYFDFDKATSGSHTLAWLREVMNAETEDNMLYQIMDENGDMTVDYTFALDMAKIEIPAQLADITYMLPGADAGSTAWDFMLQLAERISSLTEVTVSVQFDQNLIVDISELKIVCEYFELRDLKLDENNLLTVTCGWIKRSQAIDSATARSLCIVSGIKATLKEEVAKGNVVIKNTGTVAYKAFMRATSLYSFACQPENQAKYALHPYDGTQEEFYFNGKPLMYNGKGEAGAYFCNTYADFEDSFVLCGEKLQGWNGEGKNQKYYVDGVAVTGIQYLPSIDDSAVKAYYVFDVSGNCLGKYTGIIEENGKIKYALGGILQKGWQSVMDENGESHFYYFNRQTYAAVGGGDGWIEVEGYSYLFQNYKCVKGTIVKTSQGYQYRFAGRWQRDQWIEYDGKMYYINHSYIALTGGFNWVRTVDGTSNARYLFGDDGVWQQDVTGLYHVGEDTYLLENGVVQGEPGLVFIDGYYYYFCSTGKAVKNRTYWPTKTNGLLPVGPYIFDEQGRITNPPVTEPDVPETPETPDTPDTPDVPVKDGLVQENGGYFYYKDGKVQYGAGLIQIGEDFYYIRSNGQAAVGNYWITTTNGLKDKGMYIFGADGKMKVDTDEEPEQPDVPGVPEEPKNGIVDQNGVLYYYIDGTRAYSAGVLKLTDENGAEFYIYVRSNGQLATGIYWPTVTNDLLSRGGYNWGEDGRYYPPAQDDSQEPTQPETPVEPEIPVVKEGIISEGGVLYYYINGTRAYGAGVLKLMDENGAEFYIYVRSNGQLATGIYWPTTTNGLLNRGGYDWGTDGRLYL